MFKGLAGKMMGTTPSAAQKKEVAFPQPN